MKRIAKYGMGVERRSENGIFLFVKTKICGDHPYTAMYWKAVRTGARIPSEEETQSGVSLWKKRGSAARVCPLAGIFPDR